jgi:hypothetical protein
MEFKNWMLQATRDRYQPPATKTAMDILPTMRVKADNNTKKPMIALMSDRVLPSISGTEASMHHSALPYVAADMSISLGIKVL